MKSLKPLQPAATDRPATRKPASTDMLYKQIFHFKHTEMRRRGVLQTDRPDKVPLLTDAQTNMALRQTNTEVQKGTRSKTKTFAKDQQKAFVFFALCSVFYMHAYVVGC